MVSIKEGSIDTTLEDSLRDFGTLAHLSIIEGNTGEVWDDSLGSVLLEILIDGGVDKGSNGGLSGRDNLGKNSALQERDQDVGNLGDGSTGKFDVNIIRVDVDIEGSNLKLRS